MNDDKHNDDFVLLFDNSCGLDDDDCEKLLEGVGHIISGLLDGGDGRVQTMQMKDRGNAKTLVSFSNTELQKNPKEYADYIREHGECTNGGNGKTDVSKALSDAANAFNLDDRQKA
eukprot:TRINITY_DN6024_c0_g1_i1.p1 TRINITY_DN6024_c0_g1~~TRINITY_DN6024_c0_g1_i1.p1  ORF type:complete len:116 (-),score=33.30 TRINITY_DN6024_c0_g1_i1:78-425(-)